MDVHRTNTTGNTSSSVMAYSYPTHVITVSDLNSGTTYNYCVIATNTTDKLHVGEPVCGNFTTKIITTTDECKYIHIMNILLINKFI